LIQSYPKVTPPKDIDRPYDSKLCSSCGGIGYVHKQSFYIENGKQGSELNKEQNCAVCKGTGFTNG
jgi:hypothetical protein